MVFRVVRIVRLVRLSRLATGRMRLKMPSSTFRTRHKGSQGWNWIGQTRGKMILDLRMQVFGIEMMFNCFESCKIDSQLLERLRLAGVSPEGLRFFVLTFKTSKMLRDAARIQSVWPTLEEFGCSGCEAVAPWNNSNLNNHRLKMNPCRGKYLLNFTRGIKCVCLCPYSTISIHFPVLTWAKVYYCSEMQWEYWQLMKQEQRVTFAGGGWKVSLQQIK